MTGLHAPRLSTQFGLLCWLYGSLYLCRQVPGLLVEPWKKEFHLSDAELGALTGSCFSIVYALLGTECGTMADRLDRASMVIWGALLWSAASAVGMAATGFGGLVASRAGVAAGEALATAAAVALVADLVPPARRARAAAVFFLSAYVGAGLAFAAGDALLALVPSSAPLSGWRTVLACAALPGLAGAVSLLAVRPRALHPEPSAAGHAREFLAAPGVVVAGIAVMVQLLLPTRTAVPIVLALALAASLRWIQGLHRTAPDAFRGTFGSGVYLLFLTAFAATLFIDYAAAFWLLPFAQRRYGPEALHAGAQLGGLMIVFGALGAMVGGAAADYLQRFYRSGRARVAAAAVLFEGLTVLWAVNPRSYPEFLAAYTSFCLAGGAWLGAAGAIGMDIVPARSRGIGSAGYFLVTTVIGLGLGPYVAGCLSDSLGSLARALACCCGALVIALAAFGRLIVCLDQCTHLAGADH